MWNTKFVQNCSNPNNLCSSICQSFIFSLSACPRYHRLLSHTLWYENRTKTAKLPMDFLSSIQLVQSASDPLDDNPNQTNWRMKEFTHLVKRVKYIKFQYCKPLLKYLCISSYLLDRMALLPKENFSVWHQCDCRLAISYLPFPTILLHISLVTENFFLRIVDLNAQKVMRVSQILHCKPTSQILH